MDIAREIQLMCSGVYTVVLLLLINAVNDWPNLSRHFESSVVFNFGSTCSEKCGLFQAFCGWLFCFGEGLSTSGKLHFRLVHYSPLCFTVK